MRRAIETGDVIWSSKRRNLSLGQFTDNACQVLSRPDLVCDTVNGKYSPRWKFGTPGQPNLQDAKWPTNPCLNRGSCAACHLFTTMDRTAFIFLPRFISLCVYCAFHIFWNTICALVRILLFVKQGHFSLFCPVTGVIMALHCVLWWDSGPYFLSWAFSVVRLLKTTERQEGNYNCNYRYNTATTTIIAVAVITTATVATTSTVMITTIISYNYINFHNYNCNYIYSDKKCSNHHNNYNSSSSSGSQMIS